MPLGTEGSLKVQVTSSMSPKNGLDTVAYSVNNGGVITHDPILKYFTFGAAMSSTIQMKNTTHPIRYMRFDGAANST